MAVGPRTPIAITALSAAGLPTDAFTFLGFLARKGKERASQLELLSTLPHTGVVYEAPNRVGDTLEELAQVMGGAASARRAVLARELTKKFEEFRRGSVVELAAGARERPPRGEVVLLIEGCGAVVVDEAVLRDAAQALRREGATTKEIVRSLVDRFGAARNLAYRVAQDA